MESELKKGFKLKTGKGEVEEFTVWLKLSNLS